MRLIAILLLSVSIPVYSQLDTVDLSIHDFGVPSIPGYTDFVRSEMYKVNTAITELDTLLEPIHLFMYFGDSAVSKSYTTSWAQLTNTGDSLFIQSELEGFTVSGDTIICTYGGDYDLDAKLTHDGDNGETVSIRFYNVTKTAGIPVAGASTTRAANNFMSTPVTAYGTISAGDSLVIQYKGDASGTAVFKNGSIRIYRIH